MAHSMEFERLVDEARPRVREITVDELRAKQARGECVRLIDARALAPDGGAADRRKDEAAGRSPEGRRSRVAASLKGKVLLDTNVFIDYLRAGLHTDWVAGQVDGTVRFLSAVVLMELRLGATSP